MLLPPLPGMIPLPPNWLLRFSPKNVAKSLLHSYHTAVLRFSKSGQVWSSPVKSSQVVTTIELVVTTVESVRDSKSERTSLLNDTIVCVKL
jgi:predicted DNA-binding protein with PD1-like motif